MMFGLEYKNKKEDAAEFLFDLETELKDVKARSEVEKKLMDRVQEIKNTLRSGSDKESYDWLGIVLYGYVSLLKVISVLGNKSKH